MLDAENAAILKWLVGREELLQPKYPSPGRAALVRRLRNREALADDVLNALANAFEAIGSSRMKFALILAPRGRGRPRKNAGSIYEAHKDAAETEAAIEAQEGEGRKRLRDLATGDQAEIKGKSKSKLYADRAALRRAKGVEK